MKFFTSLFLVIILAVSAQAATGDTTWVQAQTDIRLDYYNNFDTTVKFPDGSTKYRKIIMIFTLGKYVCPGSPMYCSDWDYTVQTYAMNKVGDTVELGRLITPYGKGARMPAAWTQPFYFDVTDYTTVLRDSNKIRIHYSGYSGGFTANIKFAMIEGTPERDIIGVKSMWDGSFTFGSASDPIDAKVAAKSLTAPAGTVSATYRLNITGHGSDDMGCSEFCQKYYKVMKDGNLVNEKLIWRDNCGFNNLYPQSGTWVYNRGNWCPGDLVYTNFHPLPGISSGTTFDLGMTFEPYTSTGGAASYTIFGSVIYYGGFNRTLDASLEDIIAPTTNDNHYRSNARVGRTTIRVRNTGSTVIKNIDYEYGVTGQPLIKINWSVNIPPLTDSIIELPNNASLFAASGTDLPYEVNIVKVNGVPDEDASNNKAVTRFNAAPVWPSKLNITLMTNNAITPAGFSETEWKVIDDWENVIAKRVNNDKTTTYRDTLDLKTGIYKLIVSDAGCNGVSWWAAPADGSGSVIVRNGLYVVPTPGNFSGDFGCGFTQEFRVGTPSVSIANVNEINTASLNVYPNPASDMITVSIEGLQGVNGVLQITDNTGRVINVQKINEQSVQINTTLMASGLYFVNFISARADIAKTSCKLLIAK